MKRLSSIFLIVLASTFLVLPKTFAQVFGWDGYSFDWTVFRGLLEKIRSEHRQRTSQFGFYYGLVSRGVDDTEGETQQALYDAAKKLEKTGDKSQTVVNAKQDLFDLMLLDALLDNPSPALKIKDFSAIYFSSITPSSLSSIYSNQVKSIKDTWFRLFQAGRRPDSNQRMKRCLQKPHLFIHYRLPWGVCAGAYFILSPDEAARFATEIRELKARKNEWLKPAYSKDMNKLLGMLEDASKHGKAILFVGHIF